MVSDGAVVYINGNEIAAINLPSTGVTSSTYASGSTIAPDEYVPYFFSASGMCKMAMLLLEFFFSIQPWLRSTVINSNTTNIVQVEVHTSAANAGTLMSFDLKIQFYTASSKQTSFCKNNNVFDISPASLGFPRQSVPCATGAACKGLGLVLLGQRCGTFDDELL